MNVVVEKKKVVVGGKKKTRPLTTDELRTTPKKAKLHSTGNVPLGFFHEATETPDQFLEPEPAVSAPSQNGTEETPPPSSNSNGDKPIISPSLVSVKELKRFGLYGEALLRDCYDDLLQEINEINTKRNADDDGTAALLIEIRGSAGIGKSVFLAYLMALQKRAGLKNIALFHAPKAVEGETRGLDQVLCSVWINGRLEMDGVRYGLDTTHDKLQQYMPALEGMFMDGCSTDFNIENFDGVIYAAASPSVYTMNIRKALGNRWKGLYMPPWSLDEAIAAGNFLNVSSDVVEENYSHMNGISRYFFEKDSAKTKVEESVELVNPRSIMNLVSSNETDKRKEKAMVHSLVLWEPQKVNGKYDYRKKVRFRLVSRFAEKKVAEKLSKVDLANLLEARQMLAPMSGAEGYAGALFEAYAIKKISGGGTFKISCLEAGEAQKSMDLTIDPINGDPVIVECNTLSPSTVPLDSVHVKTDDDSWQAKVLWPITNNFPFFDCFYFHTDGEVYPLQMTVAKETHELKTQGAYQTMNYLNKIDTCKRPYKAVFVCPEESQPIKRQKFTSSVKDGKKIIMEEEAAKRKMNKTFQQWILQL